MCGVFVVLKKKKDEININVSFLKTLQHRGPDSQDFIELKFSCANQDQEFYAWLGHVRLSIIDLTTSSNQPMFTADKRYAVVFNGEIYNYIELREELKIKGIQFNTNSDTEVLLKLWEFYGRSCLTKIKGMFAFVVIDTLEGTATVVRDFFGIKPIYYSETESSIVIASEILPIIEYLRLNGDEITLNPPILYEYIRFGATHLNDETLFTQVKCLPPACMRVYDYKSSIFYKEEQYWELVKESREISFSNAVEECRERFLQNVKLHLRSDVPLAAALSGGIDSSSIVCAAKYLEPDLDIQLYSYIPTNKSASEEKWIDIVHSHVGGKCTKIRPLNTDLEFDFRDLVKSQGEPFTSASIYAQYRVFKAVSEAGIKVSLDGQGADELLGGYWPHVGTYGSSLLKSGKFKEFIRLISAAQTGANGKFQMISLVAQNYFSNDMRAFLRKLLNKSFDLPYLNREWMVYNRIDTTKIANRLIGQFSTVKDHLISSVRNGSLPNLLRYADRNSMCFSVESRVPFLTHDFAEFFMSLPDEYLISSTGERKYVFREAMVGILPEEIRKRKDKIGFFADDAAWIRANEAFIRKYIDSLLKKEFIEKERLEFFVDGFFGYKHENSHLIWRLAVLGCLLDMYNL